MTISPFFLYSIFQSGRIRLPSDAFSEIPFYYQESGYLPETL